MRGDSRFPRTVPPEDSDGPLNLAEFVRVATRIGVETARTLPERPLDVRAARPSSAEPGRVDSHGLETEDAEGGVDPLRLQVELAEVVEHAPGLVPSLDAVPPVTLTDRRTCMMVPAAGEAEEEVRHGAECAHPFMGFRVARGGQSLY